MARGYGAIGIPGCAKSPMRAFNATMSEVPAVGLEQEREHLQRGGSGADAGSGESRCRLCLRFPGGRGSSMTALMEDSFAPYLESISELFADSLVSFFAYPRELFRTIGFERIAFHHRARSL